MKKTFKRIAIICSLLIFVTLNLTACKKECDHIYDNTCDTICNECEQERETIEHNFSTSFETNETHHWYVCQNEGCTATNLKEEHIHEDDNDCTTEVLCTICNTMLEKANTHDFSTTHETDETHHWYICQNEGCTIVTEKETHTGEATCIGQTCEDCGTLYGDANQNNHVNTETKIRYATETHHEIYYECCGAVIGTEEHDGAPTCRSYGYCTLCLTGYADPNPNVHESEAVYYIGIDGENHGAYHSCCHELKESLPHQVTLKLANCLFKGQCDDCGSEVGEVNKEVHYPEGEYIELVDDTYHHEICRWCETVLNTEEHTGTATCIERAYCDICEKIYGETDLNNHVSDEFTYMNSGQTHEKLHACCFTVVIEQEEHDRNLSSEDGIYDICSACDAKLFKEVTWVESSTDRTNINEVILSCTLTSLNSVSFNDITITLKPGELIKDEEVTIKVSDGTIVDSGEKNTFGYREAYYGSEDSINLVFDNPLADENHPTGSTVTIDFILTMISVNGFKYDFTCSVTLEYV